MSVLSPLSRGRGSWDGDLEVKEGKSISKPVLKQLLDKEAREFLDKTVQNPLRIKSKHTRIKSILKEVSQPASLRKNPPNFADTIRAKTPSTVLSRPSTCRSRVTSKHKYSNNPSHVNYVAVNHNRAKSAPSSGRYSTESESSYGRYDIPKTYFTRKGAMMLFTSPQNLAFSPTEEKCYYYDPNDEDASNVALQKMKTINKFTASILQYGNPQYPGELESFNSQYNKTCMGFVKENAAGIDVRAQPGGDFVFYLKDVQSKSMIRNLVRSASYQSLTSLEAAEDLEGALGRLEGDAVSLNTATIDDSLRDISLIDEGSVSMRDGAKSVGSHTTCFTRASGRTSVALTFSNRPDLVSSRADILSSRSGSVRSGKSSYTRVNTPLSAEKLTASLRSSPYLGHPLTAPYPPSGYHSYVPVTPSPAHSEDEDGNEETDGEREGGESRACSVLSVRTSSRRSLRSESSHKSDGARSVTSDVSGRSIRSYRSTVKSRQLEGERSESKFSVVENEEGEFVEEDVEVEVEVVDGDEEIVPGDSNVAVRSKSQISIRSQRSQKSKEEDAVRGEEGDVHLDEEELDWKSETLDVPASDEEDLEEGLEAELDKQDEMDLADEAELQQDNEDGAGRSKAPSDSPMRMYTPRTRSSGRTTPIHVDEDTPEAVPRTPSARSRSSHKSRPVSKTSVKEEVPEEAGEAEKTQEQWPEEEDINNEKTVAVRSRPSTAKGSPEHLTEVVEEEEVDANVSPKAEGASVEKEQEEASVHEDVEEEPRPPSIQSVKPSQPRKSSMLLEEDTHAASSLLQESKSSPKPPSSNQPLKPKVLTPAPPKTAPPAKKSALTLVTMKAKTPPPQKESLADLATKPSGNESANTKMNIGIMAKATSSFGKKSPRPGKKRGGGGKGKDPTTFSGPQVEFVESLAIDAFQGPSQAEIDQMIAIELSKELGTEPPADDDAESESESKKGKGKKGKKGKKKNKEENKEDEKVEEDVDSLATDDEAIEREMKKQAQKTTGKKPGRKKLAKEKAALKEARRQEKLRREEEKTALEEKKRQMEAERKRLEMEENQRKEELADRIADAEREAEMAREAEEEAKQLMLDAKKKAREEREAKRKEEAERKRLERDRQRDERRKMEEAARLREQEMAEKLASAEEMRKMREQARIEREEREREEEEEREHLEDEERMRMEEEEDRIREMERMAEEDAMRRLVEERQEAERRMRLGQVEKQRQLEEDERKRQEEARRKAEEREKLRLIELELERKRQEDLDRIRHIQKLEEDARGRVRKELERRRRLAMRRREQNLESRDHLNSIRRTQGMTKPWVFSYYVHWPRDTYEKKLPSGDKKKKRGVRPRAKTAPVAVEAHPPPGNEKVSKAV